MAETAEEPRADEVFISYSRVDEEFAREVARGLTERGLTTWIDREDIPPATDWMTEINEGMASAEGLVAIISPDWAGSEVCGVEIDTALSLGKRVVPILRTMADDVHPELARRNWIFWRDDSEAESALDAVEEALRVDPDWTREHTRLLQQALRWDGRGGDKSLLLRGQDLSTAELAVGTERPPGVPQVTELQRRYVQASRSAASSRLRRLVMVSLTVAAVSIGLAIAAIVFQRQAVEQRQEAIRQEGIAIEQRDEADRQRAEAIRQEEIAIEQRDEADRQRAEAERQRDTATSTALASQSANNVEAEPDLAALLALEAFRTRDTVDARGSLLQALGTPTRFAGRIARHATSITAIAHHEATNLAATADESGVVVLWDTDPAGVIAGVPRDDTITADGSVTSMAFTPDGSFLVVATSEDGVEIWDVAVSPPSLTGRSATDVGEVVVFGDGSLAVGFGVDDTDEVVLVMYDVAADEQVAFARLGISIDELRASDPSDLAFSADASRVAFGVGDEIFVWDVTESDVADVINIQDRDLPNVAALALDIHSVAFVGDGSQIVFAIDEGDLFVTNVDGAEGTALQAFPPPTSPADALTSVTLITDGVAEELMASAHRNGEVKLWVVEDGLMFETATLLGHDEEALAVGFASGGSLASGSWDGDVIWWSGTPSTKLGRPILFPGETRSHPFDVSGVEYIRDDLIVSLDADGLARSWDPVAGDLIDEALAEGIWSIDEQSGLMALGADDGSMIAVDADDGSTIEFDAELDSPVKLVAVSPDRSMIVSVQEDGTVGLWDVAGRSFVRFADTPADLQVETVAFASLEQLWVGGHIAPEDEESYSVAVRLDAATGETLDTLWHNDGEFGHIVTAIAVSPDGSTLVTGGSDRRIFVWDLNDLSAATAEWAGHREVVTDLVFLNDGVLLAGDAERRVLMWDVASGRAVGELSGPTDGVQALDLRPDGSYLVAGGEDDTVWIWDMRIDEWIEGACNLAGRNMTDQEWARFRLGDEPVRHCEAFAPDAWELATYPTTDG